MRTWKCLVAMMLLCGDACGAGADAVAIIPPADQIKRDRPRVLVRPVDSPYAVSLRQLKAMKRDADFEAALRTLKAAKNAAAQAMVWLLTGDEQAVDKAIARIKAFDRVPPKSAFDVFFGLRELALAYDWLGEHPKFTDQLKVEIRDKAFQLAEWGLAKGEDHLFHNYTWMNNSGMALWALASYGDDPRSEKIMQAVRFRFNDRLFPAMRYLAGLPGDSMGYWYVYCFGTCVWTLASVQSAFEIDVNGPIADKQDDWLARQVASLVHGTLPDLRFFPWGDKQLGADGGVTHEIAGVLDAATRMTGSPHGAWFSNYLADKRGMPRFFSETAILYFLHTRQMNVARAEPPLAMLAGGRFSGQAMMRSSWEDDATIVGFRCTDYHQGHDHYDAGSFVIYRHGLLAIDAGRYTRYTRELRDPIAATEAHNSLLLGGKGQRPVQGQWYRDLELFTMAKASTRDDRRLERGDITFYKHNGDWTAVAGQFAQAYAPDVVESCARQLLFVRPGTVVVVDNLVAPPGKKVPEVTWMLHVPTSQPEIGAGSAAVRKDRSWLRCRNLLSDGLPSASDSQPTQLRGAQSEMIQPTRIDFKHGGGERVLLVHLLEVGAGRPTTPIPARLEVSDDAVRIILGGRTFVLSRTAPFAVRQDNSDISETR